MTPSTSFIAFRLTWVMLSIVSCSEAPVTPPSAQMPRPCTAAQAAKRLCGAHTDFE